MALDDLVSVIETLQQRMNDYGSSLRQNETRTRTALINPLLCALGWDVSDPEFVTTEYNVGEGRADYALIGLEPIPTAMVEAKRLGHPLSDDERMQMLNYANARGVRYAAVTDGDIWEFYEVFKQAPLEDRRLMNLSIDNTPAFECALKLLILWRPNVSSGKATSAEEPLVPPNTTNLSSPVQHQPESSPATPIVFTPGAGWRNLSSFIPNTGDPHPAALRFQNGDEYEMISWRQILQQTVGWLWTQGKLTMQHTPISSSKQRYIVNLEPSHPDGKAFHNKLDVHGTPFVIEVNISNKAAISNTKKLLNHCGVNPADVWLKVDP